jgi:hypothetical protein
MKKGTVVLSTDILESYDDEDDEKRVAGVPKNTVGVVLGPLKKVNVPRNGTRPLCWSQLKSLPNQIMRCQR